MNGCASEDAGNSGSTDDQAGSSGLGGNVSAAGGGGTASGGRAGGNEAGRGGSLGSAGTGNGNTEVTLHIDWSTWELSGTSLSPVTCEMFGANTVGFQFTGRTLPIPFSQYSSNDVSCAAGNLQMPWKYGPGDFGLRVGIWPSLAVVEDEPAIVRTNTEFTVPPETADVVIPDVEIVFARYPLAWTIEKAGAPATCGDAGATKVEIRLVRTIDSNSVTSIWPGACESPPTSPPVYPGTYALSANLLDGAGASLASWTTPSPFVVTAQSAPPLPAIVFVVP